MYQSIFLTMAVLMSMFFFISAVMSAISAWLLRTEAITDILGLNPKETS